MALYLLGLCIYPFNSWPFLSLEPGIREAVGEEIDKAPVKGVQSLGRAASRSHCHTPLSLFEFQAGTCALDQLTR